MKKGRFTEEQITFVLRQHEAGTSISDITRQMDIAELRRLKQLEEENRKLKQTSSRFELGQKDAA